ncbi:MAG: TonB-dependent receptor [Bacteroidetes bacterium]|nr:TonB-dependent receptor [Bacteroidota bacterium]
MKRVLILSFLIFIISQSHGQSTGEIGGQIINDHSGLPVENVTVQIVGSAIGTSSDTAGYFILTNVPEGRHRITFSHIGFLQIEKTVEVQSDKLSRLDIFINPDVKLLHEFVVKETSPDRLIISKMPYVETDFYKFQLQNEAVRDVGDYLRSSKNINGIRKGGTQIDPVVRGFKFSQLNVTLNGGQKIEGGCPNRMDPASAHVEIEDIESIKVIKGPYALRYGPSFGAMINLQTEQKETAEKPYVDVRMMQAFESNWNGDKQQISVTGGNKLGFITLSGGRKNYGNYKDGNGQEVQSSFSKYNYKGMLGVKPFKNHLLLLTYEESKGRDIRFPTLPMDERKDDTQLMSADYQVKHMGDLLNFINLKVYQSDVRHEMDNKYRPFSDTVVAVSIINAVTAGGRAEAGMKIGAGELILGGDLERIEKDGRRDKNMIMQPNLPVKVEKLWNNAHINNTGAFALYTGNRRKWEWIASARIDFNQASSEAITIKHPMLGEIYHYGEDSIKTDYTNLSFSAGATYAINDKFSVSLAAGRGIRSPDMTERFIILLPIGYDKFDYLGNPQLEPEANNEIDLTLKFRDGKKGYLQINGFYSFLDNYITGRRLPPALQKPLSADVLGVKQFYNAGNARLRGFEFSYSSPEKYKLGATLFAAFTYGTLDESVKYVLNEQGEVVDDEIVYDDALTEIPPLESTFNIHYRFLKGRFVPAMNVRMVASQNHVSEASYEPSTPGFAVAGFSFNFVFNSHFTITGGINNIFDQAYYEHLNRNIIGSTRNLYEPGRSFYINLFINF